MPRAAPAELIHFLAPFSDEVHELALGLRARVLTVMPKAHEFVWDATNAVSLAYTPTTRWQDSVVHIASYAKWVNLGFNASVQVHARRQPAPAPRGRAGKVPVISSWG